jgi:hypothetical protein
MNALASGQSEFMNDFAQYTISSDWTIMPRILTQIPIRAAAVHHPLEPVVS